MNFNPTKNKKRRLKVKIFLTIFLFIFLFVNVASIANAANAAGTPTEARKGSGNQNPLPAQAQEVPPVCDAIDWAKHPIDCTLITLLPVMGTFVIWSVAFFEWSFNEKTVMAVLDDGNIYIIWQEVRDALNMAFILFLLFTAFCTVFQISKYSFKNTMLNIVLMALLVNFSFPIARFIIDISNVLAYTIFGELIQAKAADGVGIAIMRDGQLVKALAGQNLNATTTTLLMSVIFLFILGMTFFMMGALFIIRTIALAILIIFSPVAFTGSIIPGLQEKASKWWTELFNYSFFAPVMLFMIYIALALMVATTQSIDSGLAEIAENKANDVDYLADISKFIVPIAILWMGMGVAKSMSIAGAGAITDWTQGKIKGTGKWLAQAPFKATKEAAKFAGKQTGFTGGIQQRWSELKKKGPLGSDALGARESKWAEGLGVSGAKSEYMRKMVQEKREAWKKTGGLSDTELDNKVKNGNEFEKAAAAMEMAEKNGFGDGLNPAADLAKYQAAKAATTDPVLKKLFDEKVEEKHIRLVIEDDIATNHTAPDVAYEKHLKNMSAEKLAKQKNLLNTDAFHDNFMNKKKAGGSAEDLEFIKEVAKRMTSDDRRDWKDNTRPNRNYAI